MLATHVNAKDSLGYNYEDIECHGHKTDRKRPQQLSRVPKPMVPGNIVSGPRTSLSSRLEAVVLYCYHIRHCIGCIIVVIVVPQLKLCSICLTR